MTTPDQTRVLDILRGLLEAHDGIEQAFIIGDWAAHAAGISGHEPRLVPAAGTPGLVPSGVQVLVVSEMRPREASALAVDASETAGETVYVRAINAERWTSGDSDYLREIRMQPMIDLMLHGDLAQRAADIRAGRVKTLPFRRGA